ncbi:alpha/beta hydrolase [Sphaerisporangium rubeum]|uniref:Pimeloyl-ACP methyl ester carboxylesterase n=1 Tax=Sphaerisporangium rubeum TaxID=321317 RepID=A0A7X0II10_9ACTN|nr:alpha/beta hydrolase [Sphaerisporangium rubeum]MBB6475546.1 pimeloyl-ACP methyl ester carboxylesterase [Sphaerisporangium rubeum]
MDRVRVNGIEIAYDTFGDAGGRVLVLIMGLGAQMISWDEEFCAELAAAGHYVVRFDNRDAGLSTHLHEAGVPRLPAARGEGVPEAPYLLKDMAADTAGLLDVLGLDAVHVVGASMGGMIAQEFAIRYPGRTLSLTSIMSTTSPDVGAPTELALGALLAPAAPDRESVVRRAVESWKVLGSPAYPADEARVREIAGQAYDRSFDPPGFGRQFAALLASGDRTAALRELSVPALVIHGEADQLVQLAGGVATADAIPGAKLLTFPGMGHDLPRALWPDFVAAITELTTRAAVL